MLQHGIESLRLGLETSGKSDELEVRLLFLIAESGIYHDVPWLYNLPVEESESRSRPQACDDRVIV